MHSEMYAIRFDHVSREHFLSRTRKGGTKNMNKKGVILKNSTCIRCGLLTILARHNSEKHR